MNKKQITIKGVDLTYFESGTGRNILFLHGGRLRSLTFKKILTELSKNNHVIAPDIPGYGDSSTPTDIWSFKGYAEFFLNFIETLKMHEITVIGYSMGGGIAYHLASISSKVTKLILVDSTGIEKRSSDQLKYDSQRVLFYFTHPQYLRVFLTLIKEYMLFSLKHLKNFEQIKNIREKCDNSSSYLGDLNIPTSIIWARGDTIFPAKIAKKLHDSIKSSTLEFVDGNHDWVLYESERFLNCINKTIL